MRHLEPPAPRCLGRSRSLASGQRHLAWCSHDLGWACPGTHGAVYESPCGRTLPCGAQGVFSAPPGDREARESGLDRLYAQALDDSQRYGETPDTLATPGGIIAAQDKIVLDNQDSRSAPPSLRLLPAPEAQR